MDELIDTNAQVEPVIKDFFYFTEGIVWVPQGKGSGHWLFAEMAANKILKLPMDGKLSLYFRGVIRRNAAGQLFVACDSGIGAGLNRSTR